ncbi:type IV secretory system conjugative DNA transfer family protein [Listeria monocytogenes]|nr:type IV secretory system conjugative DNA transfer family protein [Listeria monocytogenes]EBF5125242.1 type IV secretory system conjugative DNA transfer family protein [Listeria monocytogenes]EBF5202809.1 type IV secretory system conjugative DNA transfer family protein [Listeria monocytogenes]
MVGYNPRKSRQSLSASFYVKLGGFFLLPVLFVVNGVRYYFIQVYAHKSMEITDVFQLEHLFNSNTDWPFYGMVTIVLVMVIVFLVYRQFGDVNIGIEGVRRFAFLRELKKEYKIVPDRKKTYEGDSGFPISHFYKWEFQRRFPYIWRNGYYLIDNGESNNQVLAPTRGGKGENIIKLFLDIISRATTKPSLFLNDMKGELALSCVQPFQERGIKTLILNFIRPELGSIQINPLDDIREAYENALENRLYREGGEWKNFSEIREIKEKQRIEKEIREGAIQEEIDGGVAVDLTTSLCEQLIPLKKNATGNDFWITSPRSLLAALVLYVCDVCTRKALYASQGDAEKHRAKVTLYTVAITLNQLGSSYEEKKKKVGMGVDKFNLLDKTFAKLPEGHPAKNEYTTSKFAGEAPQTRAGIFSACANALSLFMKPSIAKITAKSTFRLEELGFGEEPIALFSVIPEADKSYHALSSLFVSMIYQVNTRRCLTAPGQRCARQIKFVLDEKGQMTPIENYNSMVSMGLGKGIDFMQALQDDNQLEDLYGREKAKIIRQGMSNEVFLISKDETTTKRVSNELGHTQVYVRNRKNESNGDAVKRRKLLMPEELAELYEGESIILRVTKRKDRKGNKIKPRPIFNTGATTMPYAWKIIPEFNSRDRLFEELPLDQTYKTTILGDLLLDNPEAKNYFQEKWEKGGLAKMEIITDPEIEEETGAVTEKQKEAIVSDPKWLNETSDTSYSVDPWEDNTFKKVMEKTLPAPLSVLIGKRKSVRELRSILEKLVLDQQISKEEQGKILAFFPEKIKQEEEGVT